MERIMNTLPDQDLMCAQMAVSFTLSNPPADEVMSYASKNDHWCIFEGFLGRISNEAIYRKETIGSSGTFFKRSSTNRKFYPWKVS